MPNTAKYDRSRATSRLVAHLFLQLFLFISVPAYVRAVSADPEPLILVQSDGTIFHAGKWGDENINGFETVDGYTIMFDGAGKNWTFAERGENGTLVRSAFIVGKDLPRSLTKHLRPPELEKTVMKKMSGRFAEALKTGTPTRGLVPVILTNFADRRKTYPKEAFSSLIFGTRNGSLKDYYEEVSYAKFSLSGEIAGWYTAAKPHDYYGANSKTGRDLHPAELTIEMITKADAEGFDFSQYDLNGDCYVDVVAIVHQGTGEESANGVTDDIWSQSWNLNSAQRFKDGTGEYTTHSTCRADKTQKVKVNDFVTISEIGTDGGLTTIGVLAHEYGHALGLPDLYDTYALNGKSNGIGFWSLMASGTWNKRPGGKRGDSPAHMDAWSKYKLNWITPKQIKGRIDNQPVRESASYPDCLQILDGGPNQYIGEYFLIENRQQTRFDAGIPGSGLIIWHVDEMMVDNGDSCVPTSAGSCAAQHYKVELVQADNLWHLEQYPGNRGDEGDPFPGATNNHAFTPNSQPASLLHNGADSGVSVINVTNSGTVMSATVVNGKE